MRVLIGIHAAHCQPEAMQSQRDTWLKDLKADYRFVLGDPPITAPDVLWMNGPDGPIRNRCRRTWVLNRKTEALVQYALSNGYDYLFKCDDDTFVIPERLLSSGFEQHDYSGLTEKHWTAETGWYRWSQGGAGYWLSRRAMKTIAEHGLHLVDAEDFAVGQLLHVHGIAPFHDERYCHLYTPDSKPPAQFITAHKIAPVQMRQLSDFHGLCNSRSFTHPAEAPKPLV